MISSGAVRLDGTRNCYVMPEYPAVANYEVLLALIEAAETLDVDKYHVGITATIDRVLNSEMETATLFTLTSLCGLRAGAVCAVFANRVTDEFKVGSGEEGAVKVADEAVRILDEWDREKKEKRRKLGSMFR